MTIEELVQVADAVEVNSENIQALLASRKESEKEFEREERQKCLDHESLARSYSF
ncbi:hypothetical protein [Azovibrio restrictus]|uniref:hypothetical protein n=1 Tax=Azovibrio restrictus TaxID=146938 RepID=UPI0026EBE859|nr:hypothetical protein [Azovibrio restrictus]MDD3482354.1 hypothetical protein [Azovibrio restrictus]